MAHGQAGPQVIRHQAKQEEDEGKSAAEGADEAEGFAKIHDCASFLKTGSPVIQ